VGAKAKTRFMWQTSWHIRNDIYNCDGEF